jgi:uncharacterized protein
MRVVYLHGFASSPRSSKARFFREKFLGRGVDIQIPQLDGGDFERLTISGQLRIVEQTVDEQPAVLMGSSLGGYLCALYAARHPERVVKMVLLAPAFCFPSRFRERYTPEELEAWRTRGTAPVFHYGYNQECQLGYHLLEDAQQFEDFPAFQAPALIFHGRKDPVVPVELSESYAARHPNMNLQIFESGHELTDVLDPMWASTEAFLFQDESL